MALTFDKAPRLLGVRSNKKYFVPKGQVVFLQALGKNKETTNPGISRI